MISSQRSRVLIALMSIGLLVETGVGVALLLLLVLEPSVQSWFWPAAVLVLAGLLLTSRYLFTLSRRYSEYCDQ